ncbi:MAG: hypothetical protein DHS20C18_45220 [Saprospiraceae bacterium]|nr:MAG: hypothetical protein DHS20C18_45220 [Saprospiraceae bacterium]
MLSFNGLGQKNSTSEPAIDIQFSQEGGFYREEVEVALYSPKAAIYYTLDGSRPTTRSIHYKGAILLKKTAVIRAVAYLDGKESGLFGHTYLIDEADTGFPVVSIGITPYLLFDPSEGLFMRGNQVIDSSWQKPGANFWSRREISCHLDIFESDGQTVYSNQTGLRLFGGMSRLFPQKSLAIVARKRYGQSRFDYPIFGEDGPKKFKFLVLRNSGSDFGKTHFRDAFMTSLLDDWDIEKQAYRPAHVYINGQYWGIYNIREKINRYFVASNSEADKDSIDLIEHRFTRKRGSKRHYQRLLNFLEKNDLRDPDRYAYVGTQMEVDNFMNYQIAQIYFDNQDAGGNIKFWRPQTPDGRWRWIMYDTDWGFGLHDDNAYRNNSLQFHTAADGPNWPNPPWSTFLLRKLLENETFSKQFINRFADHLNTTFSSLQVDQKIAGFYKKLSPEMPRHLERWHLRQSTWEAEISQLRTFAQERPTYMRFHLMEKFNTGGTREVSIAATKGGTIILNENVPIRTQELKGIYFEKIPIGLKAVADYGYTFSHWEGVEGLDNARDFTLTLAEKEPYKIRAVFEPFTHPLVGKVMINEICTNNKKTGDWLEIFNYTNKSVTLAGWILTDTKNEYTLPEEVWLGPNDYLVICRDSTKFKQVFPGAYNVVGGLSFGLNKRTESLGLFSRLGAAVDSVYYNLEPRDSVFTLSLLLPTLNNGDPENWEIRAGFGSPNVANPYYVESSIRHIQEQWIQIGVAAGVVILCIILLVLRARRIL